MQWVLKEIQEKISCSHLENYFKPEGLGLSEVETKMSSDKMK
jgi:hypothetical protein